MTAHFSSLPPIPYPFMWKEGNTMARESSSDSVTKKSKSAKIKSFPVNSALSAQFLPLDWLLRPIKGKSLSERVLARLIQSEAHEAEASFRTDIRIAWQIVLHCMKGDAVECSPAVLAWYQVVGCHPDHFYGKLMIRRAAMFGTEVNRVILPKKSAEKTPSKERKQA